MNKLKYVISALAVAFLVYIFTFYIDGEMGVILLAFVLFAPLVSLILALNARDKVNVTIDCDAYVQKGNKLKVKITVRKKGVLPLALIEIKPFVSDVFDKKIGSFKLTMMEEGKQSFAFETDALYGGNGEIGIESVYSCGFLGFMRFPIKNLIENVSVGVIPMIPDVSASSQLIRALADIVATNENEEDNETAMLFTSNTVPGYEHREYVQGDPLKRINWKLSSKKSVLMVRLDEAAASVQPVIILDLYRKAGEDVLKAIAQEEKLISSTFGLVNELIKKGIACNFVFRDNSGNAVTEVVDNPDYPAQLLLKVLAVKVTEEQRISLTQTNDSFCAAVIATTDAGEGFSYITDSLGKTEDISLIVPSLTDVNSTSYPMWYLEEDNNFKMV